MTGRAGIIGHPVRQSLSPVFQNAAFRHAGLDVVYESWDTPPAALRERIAALRKPGCPGANVTIPHKEAALVLIDEPGDQSLDCGAVNTIVNRDGRLFGFNTDGPGFVQSLHREAAFDPRGASILLIGAGGAARGIAFALARNHAARLAIVNRTPARAQRLVTALGARGFDATALERSESLDGYDCIVNCTPVGMPGGPHGAPHFDWRTARRGALAVDIVYDPEETAFLRSGREHGLRTLSGLPMLIHQGALAFELWTGLPAPLDVMFAAARSALAARRQPPTGVP